MDLTQMEYRVLKVLTDGPMGDTHLDDATFGFNIFGAQDYSEAVMFLQLRQMVEKVEIWNITEKGKLLYKYGKIGITIQDTQSYSSWGLH